jgi:hypothetical protein
MSITENIRTALNMVDLFASVGAEHCPGAPDHLALPPNPRLRSAQPGRHSQRRDEKI